MPKESEIHIGRSIQAIRLHIRRLAIALESDRLRLARTHCVLDTTLEDLDAQIAKLRELFVEEAPRVEKQSANGAGPF